MIEIDGINVEGSVAWKRAKTTGGPQEGKRRVALFVFPIESFYW